MMRKKLLLLLSVFMLQFGVKAQAYLDDIMLQSFGWDEQIQSKFPSATGTGGTDNNFYDFMNARTGIFKSMGFDMIWLPPPSTSSGGVGYIPTQWFNFSVTSWGKEAEMDKMLTNMNSVGLFPLADIVVNHRGGTTGCMDFTNPSFTGGCNAVTSDDIYAGGGANSCAPTPCGTPDSYEKNGFGRNLNHADTSVQAAVKEFLTRLKSKGFKGWRWDVAKGFAPKYFGEYNNASSPYYSVGEYWDGSTDLLVSWIDGTGTTLSGTTEKSGAFDFANYYQLSSAVRNNSYGVLNNGGRMPGLAGRIGYDNKAVTFVDNHDTFPKTEGITGNTNILKAYAYILTHPGIPCVFLPHLYGGSYTKDGVTVAYTSQIRDIAKLMEIRKANGINAWSSVTIDKAESGLYAAYIKKAYDVSKPDDIAVKIGPNSWSPSGTGWTMVASSGTDYAIWTKSAINTAPIIASMTKGGTFSTGTTQNVTIGATDSDGGTPVIRYTTDGSTPTASSPVYSGAISVSATTTIKAIATDAGGKSSGVFERTYSFETLKTFTVYFKPPATWTGAKAPRIHYFRMNPSTYGASAWPGVLMTPDVDGWYKYTFTNVIDASFLFSDGTATGSVKGVNQTGDIDIVTQDTRYTFNALNPPLYVDIENLSTEDNAVSKVEASLSPNPTKGIVNVNSASDFSTYEVYSIDGALVQSGNVVNNQFNIAPLTIGNYLVKLKSSNGETITEKVIKN